MSERKGGAHKAKLIRVSIGEDSNAKLIELAQSSKHTKRWIMELFIELGHKYGFLDLGEKGVCGACARAVKDLNGVQGPETLKIDGDMRHYLDELKVYWSHTDDGHIIRKLLKNRIKKIEKDRKL